MVTVPPKLPASLPNSRKGVLFVTSSARIVTSAGTVNESGSAAVDARQALEWRVGGRVTDGRPVGTRRSRRIGGTVRDLGPQKSRLTAASSKPRRGKEDDQGRAKAGANFRERGAHLILVTDASKPCSTIAWGQSDADFPGPDIDLHGRQSGRKGLASCVGPSTLDYQACHRGC
jgi:hypothetical protein